MSAAEFLSARGVQGGGMDTFKSINTYPMQNSPMMNMPNPAAFSVHGLRTHSYSSLIGATMMINAFDMCGGEPTFHRLQGSCQQLWRNLCDHISDL